MIDNQLYCELYLEHVEKVKIFFLCKRFSPEEAEELTQDVFMRVYRFRGNFQGKGSFRCWLNVIARNLWKNRIRDLHSQKRDGVITSLDATDPQQPLQSEDQSCNPLEQLMDEEQRTLLRQAIGQLPETVSACVVLRVYHELTYEQIATVLQVPRETVKSRLYQAREKLRTILSEDMRVDFLE